MKMCFAAAHSRPITCGLPRAVSRRVSLVVSAQNATQASGDVKVLHLMRHGTTEMNEYLARHRYDAEDFKDPMMYDTVLTARGRAGAQAAARVAARLNPKPELLVVSPLTRALQTAELAFLPHYEGPVHVEPLARERVGPGREIHLGRAEVWHASDVGSSPEDLARAFPDSRFQFDALPDVWWHTANPCDPREVGLEPEGVFKERVQALRLWLAQRPEQCLAVVAHWGLLHELTGGADFENCQIRTYTLDTTRVAEGAAIREQAPSLLAALFR